MTPEFEVGPGKGSHAASSGVAPAVPAPNAATGSPADTPSAATEQRPWCECDPEYEGRCPYPCQLDADEQREAASPSPWDYADVYDGPWYVFREPRDDHRLAIKSGHYTILTVGDYFDGGGPIEERLEWLCQLVNDRLLIDGKHPEETCEECGGRNVVWFAPNDLWNRVMRGGDRGAPDVVGIICPACFIARAEAAGVEATGWLVQPEVIHAAV